MSETNVSLLRIHPLCPRTRIGFRKSSGNGKIHGLCTASASCNFGPPDTRPSLTFTISTEDEHGDRLSHSPPSPSQDTKCAISHGSGRPRPPRVASSRQRVTVVLSCNDGLMKLSLGEKNHLYSRPDATSAESWAEGVNRPMKLEELYQSWLPAWEKCWPQDKLQRCRLNYIALCTA